MKTIWLILLVHFSFGQNIKPGCAEKKWAFFHPFAAIKIKSIYKKCQPIYFEVKKSKVFDSIENGGNLDAFRHCFYMAAFAQKIKAKKIRRLGKAHEKSNFKDFKKSNLEFGETPDSLSTVMDLFNNEIGLKIGKDNKKMDLITLSKLIIKEINDGKALKMKRNNFGDYLNCEGKIINLKDYKKKWNVPKCLVKSGE